MANPDTTTTERLFPILWSYDLKEKVTELRKAGVAFLPLGVPWAMLAPHEKQAQRNHSQTLNRLAERGGLGPCEALAVLDDREWRSMPTSVSCAELCRRINVWREKEANDVAA